MKKLSNLITIVMIAVTMLQCKNSDATNTATDNSAKTSQKHSEEKENHKHDEKEDLKYVSKEILSMRTRAPTRWVGNLSP